MRCVSQLIHWLTHRIREQARSHSFDRVRPKKPVGSKAAALLLLITPPPTTAPEYPPTNCACTHSPAP
ncbi:hypothetical protein DYL59_28345, partial [Pseudomonas kairouanensis]